MYDTQKLVAVYRGGQVQTLTLALAPTRPPLPPNSVGGTGAGAGAGAECPVTPQKDVSLGTSQHGTSSPFSPLTPAAMGSITGTGAGIGAGTGTGAGMGVTGRLGANTGTNDVSAPVSGIAFSEDIPGGFLLVTTDRHVISLPLDPGSLPEEGEDGLRKKVRR